MTILGFGWRFLPFHVSQSCCCLRFSFSCYFCSGRSRGTSSPRLHATALDGEYVSTFWPQIRSVFSVVFWPQIRSVFHNAGKDKKNHFTDQNLSTSNIDLTMGFLNRPIKTYISKRWRLYNSCIFTPHNHVYITSCKHASWPIKA